MIHTGSYVGHSFTYSPPVPVSRVFLSFRAVARGKQLNFEDGRGKKPLNPRPSPACVREIDEESNADATCWTISL